MSDDRRTTRRIRLPGVQVTYESATGERQQARVVDLSREGLFIPSSKPLAVGKRISLEIQPIGDLTAWSALGRVVWVRDADDGVEQPAGMAVKIIDAEDAVVAAIERLIEAREPTERGLGFGDTVLPVRPRAGSNPPTREKTMLGVGVDATPAAFAPIVLAAPAREPTLVGVGTEATTDLREVSLAIDLITKKPPSVGPVPELAGSSGPQEPEPVEPNARGAGEREEREESGEREESEPERPAKRRTGARLLLLVLVVAGGITGYAFRDRVLVLWHAAAGSVMKQLQ